MPRQSVALSNAKSGREFGGEKAHGMEMKTAMFLFIAGSAGGLFLSTFYSIGRIVDLIVLVGLAASDASVDHNIRPMGMAGCLVVADHRQTIPFTIENS